MVRTGGNILKSTDVEMTGRFLLEIQALPPSSQSEKLPAPGIPEARIVENHPEFVVLEITCACGRKSYVKCEYATVHTDDRRPDGQETVGENQNAS
ncbi:MAG: hypothetical protein JSU94_12020 [Phycisphaerales bacterium]|nr:MAG: hypothetical protein JSU94_12020 [Phycisphaerales bacterium]